jgi:hypothetical protein
VDGFTTLSDSTYAIQRCHDVRAAHEYTKKLRSWLESTQSAQVCPRLRGEGSDWVAHDLPLCTIDCSAPQPCLGSERCRCPHDRCPLQRRGALGPFPALAHTDAVSCGPEAPVAPPSLSLVERVARLPWSAVVLPHAWRAFALPLDVLPRPHVVALPDTIDNHLSEPACYQLDKAPVPFSSDHVIVEALRERSVAVNASDFAFVPFYQGASRFSALARLS